MIMRSYTVWLVPAALMLFGFGPGDARATAQTITYPFNATYETSLLREQLTPDVSRGLVLGDPTAPIVGESILSGSIEAVPEPVSWPGTLVCIGVIGAGVLLRQRRCHSSSSSGPNKSWGS